MKSNNWEQYKYKPTTNLYRIKNLFKAKARVYVVQGGQAAGKTISILMLLLDYAARNPNKEISIVSKELSKLKKTAIRDFMKIAKDYGYWNLGKWNGTDFIFYFNNGSYIEFIGLDKSDVGKGLRRDIVYHNEANKYDVLTYTQIASRAKLNIIDFNADARFYAHDLILPNQYNFIQLDFRGNEYCPESEKQEILSYYERGFYADGRVKNEFWANYARVYGDGEIGSIAGRVFTHFQRTSTEYFDKLNLPTYYGIDWGKNDPFAIVACKYDRDAKAFYIKELHYTSENKIMESADQDTLRQILSNPMGVIGHVVTRLIPDRLHSTIIGDSHPPENVNKLHLDLGYQHAYHTQKFPGSNLANVRNMQSVSVYFTECSTNFDFEQQNFKYKEDRAGVLHDELADGNDHLIQAAMYVLRFILTN